MTKAVLCVGRDSTLLNTRVAVLRTLHIEVVGINPDEVMVLRETEFQVALLCQTLTEAERLEVCRHLKRANRRIQIVALAEVRPAGWEQSLVHTWIETGIHPAELVQVIARVLSEQG